MRNNQPVKRVNKLIPDVPDLSQHSASLTNLKKQKYEL